MLMIGEIFAQAKIQKEIIVVDNASTDGTAGFLMEKYPSIRVVCLKKNYGLHAAFNYGVKIAKGKIIVGVDHDCVFSDVNIFGGCLKNL